MEAPRVMVVAATLVARVTAVVARAKPVMARVVVVASVEVVEEWSGDGSSATV